VLSAGYAGSQGHHLLALIPANPGNPALCLSLSRPESVMPGTATCGPFGENNTYIARDGRVYEGTRGPCRSDFAGFTYQQTIGNSSYNAFQASLRPTSPQLELFLGYTFGKSLDQSSSLAEGINPVNGRLSRALSAFDLRHSFVGSYQWTVPVGRILRRRNIW